MSGFFDVCAARKRVEVLEETWGHLAPECGRAYSGFVVYALTAWSDLVLIEAEFTGLDSSPWFFDDLNQFVADSLSATDAVGVWRWDGSYTRFKNGGSRFTKGATRPVWFPPAQPDFDA